MTPEERFATFVAASGYKYKYVAECNAVKPHQLSRILHGKGRLHTQHVAKASRLLGITTDAILIGDKEDPRHEKRA